MRACLDSWAVLAWLDGDSPACDRVDALVAERPLLSWVNAVEVYYRLERDHGREAADTTLGDLRAGFDVELPGTTRMVEVGRIKARHPMALGDCFAIATAAAHGAPLLTGDPEIIGAVGLPCSVEDLR